MAEGEATVQTLSGKSVTFAVQKTDTFEVWKRQIQESVLGYPQREQRLIWWDGQTLEDDKTPGHYAHSSEDGNLGMGSVWVILTIQGMHHTWAKGPLISWPRVWQRYRRRSNRRWPMAITPRRPSSKSSGPPVRSI